MTHRDPDGRPRRRRRWPWIAGLALTTLLLALAFRTVDWSRVASALGRASPGWLAAAVAANFLILPFATWQWIWLLPPSRDVGFRRMFRIRSVTATVANGGPFLSGYAAAVYLVATRGRVGYDAAVSFKAVEQVAVGLTKLLVVAAAVLLAPLPPSFRTGILGLVVGVPLLAAGLFVAAYRARTLERWASDRGGRWGTILDFAARVARGLEVIRRPRAFFSAVALGLAQKVAEGSAIAMVATALDVPLELGGVILVLAAVDLSTMVSVTPANVGIYEASAFAAYRVVGIGEPTALGLSVLQHLMFLIPLAGTGWLLLAVEGSGLGQILRETENGVEERRDG